MTRAAGWAVRAGALVAALCAVAASLSGCGASPQKLGPAGIDELTIPTPTPDPADFTGDATNPWFPLTAGTRWTYRQYSPTSTRVVRAEVLPGRRDIAGVSTTPVRWTYRDHGRTRTAMVRWYAVDTAGDVWWFGQRIATRDLLLDALAPHSFLAGRNGAEAGLVLTRAPRVGDGYLNAQQPHVVERRSTVVSLHGTVATTGKTFHDTVVTRDLSALAPVHTVQTYFARDVGMVAQQDTASTSTSLAFVRVLRP
jgi:hypothetical protein